MLCILAAAGTRHPRVFCPVTRGENREVGEFDLRINLAPDFSRGDLGGLVAEPVALPGASVDIGTGVDFHRILPAPTGQFCMGINTIVAICMMTTPSGLSGR
ncbi:hypothetical protein [Paraburkholderia sp.]|uniref:hypothetical protein n=1 Tax=Paraburkholderia sp. TaxID=1926495 RepID=UPI003C61959B